MIAFEEDEPIVQRCPGGPKVGLRFPDILKENAAAEKRAAVSGTEMHEHTWSPGEGFEFTMMAKCIQSFITSAAEDIAVVANKRRSVCPVGPEKTSTVCSDGLWVFSYKKKLYQYDISWGTDTHTISSKHCVADLVAAIEEDIRRKNPLRNKHVEFVSRGPRGLEVRFCRSPAVGLGDVVLDEERREDIFNNSLFHLEHLDGNNGLIFHGPPGTGKSITCQALIGEALRRGFSTCFVVGKPSFEELSRYLDEYFGPTLLIFEDIDSFGEDRLNARGHALSDFLQFLSGLSERRHKLVVIATTNHIELLDRAIRHRPVRFNRRYHFDYPTPEEVDKLFEHHFRGADLSGVNLRRCHGHRITGALVREIHRTTEMYRRRYEIPLTEAFDRALDTLLTEFGEAMTQAGAGFG